MMKHELSDEFARLAMELNTKQIRNSMKRAIRATAKKVRKIAVGKLKSSGLHVKGNKSDWDKGIRTFVYSKGGGFLVTVKPKASKSGKGDKGMHQNRAYKKTGRKLPILMWAEDGTTNRRTKGGRSRLGFGARKGKSTGVMPAYGFLMRAQPEMIRTVEADIGREVEVAVDKVARKAGLK